MGSRFNHPRQVPNSKNKNKNWMEENTQITSKETILLILNN